MQDGASLSLEDICSRLGLLPASVLEVSKHPWRFYSKFNRPKRAGGFRTISASSGQLKWIQRTLLDGILSQFNMPAHVHGCVKGRSATTNAQIHIDQDVVIKVDLSDFFGSVSLHMVTELLIGYFSFDENAAEVFARIAVNDGVLPQGAPTSPALANLAALVLDERIMAICANAGQRHGFRYSRYVDDITISGGVELIELLPSIYQCIWSTGFIPNLDKTKILRRSTRQTVTGLVVNKRASVSKALLRKIRQEIYYCRKWGIMEHCETIGVTPERFLKRLKGMIGYLCTVRPDLATEFNIDLYFPEKDIVETEEDVNLRMLKQMIDNEQVAEFDYANGEEYDFDDSDIEPAHCVVAPVLVGADPAGAAVLRAFQLLPDQGWRYFSLSYIKDLQVAQLSKLS
jgi:hypothetical protein